MTIKLKHVDLGGPGADEEIKCIGCQRPVKARDTALAGLVKIIGPHPAPAICDDCFTCPRCGTEELRVDVRHIKAPGKELAAKAYAWGCESCKANWPGNVKGVLMFTAEVSQSMVARAMRACAHFPETGPGCDGDCAAGDVCPKLRAFQACDHHGDLDDHCGLCPAKSGCEPGGLPEQLLKSTQGVDFGKATESMRSGARDPSKAN